MTGRKSAVARDAAGQVTLTSRRVEAGVAEHAVNLHERNLFMSGKSFRLTLASFLLPAQATSTSLSSPMPPRLE